MGTVMVRDANPSEYQEIGRLMVDVYRALDGFPGPEEQPEYYTMLSEIGKFAVKEHTELLAGVTKEGKIKGAVVFFSDMKSYGSGGTATKMENACGFRLLAVGLQSRGMGVGRLLVEECIERTRSHGRNRLIIHSTESMKVARDMYRKMGFKRFPAIDFLQEDLPVFGFILNV